MLLLQRTAAGPGERGPPLLTSAHGSRDSPYREARRPEATGRYTRARWRSTLTASAAAVPASSPPHSGGLSRYIDHPRPALGRSAHPCPHVPPRPALHARMSRQPACRGVAHTLKERAAPHRAAAEVPPCRPPAGRAPLPPARAPSRPARPSRPLTHCTSRPGRHVTPARPHCTPCARAAGCLPPRVPTAVSKGVGSPL